MVGYLESWSNQWFEKKKNQKDEKKFRCEQGSNLRGKIPMDFKSIALTTRPSQLLTMARLQGGMITWIDFSIVHCLWCGVALFSIQAGGYESLETAIRTGRVVQKLLGRFLSAFF